MAYVKEDSDVEQLIESSIQEVDPATLPDCPFPMLDRHEPLPPTFLR
jgi:hypothetical protein